MEERIMSSTTMWLVLVAITLLFLLYRMLHLPVYPNEPPYIPSTIPFIGHLLGFLRHNMAYYTRIK